MDSPEVTFYRGLERHLSAAQTELNGIEEPTRQCFTRIVRELDGLITSDNYGYKDLEVILMGWGWSSMQDPTSGEVLTTCSPQLFATGPSRGFEIIDLEQRSTALGNTYRTESDEEASRDLCNILREKHGIGRFAIAHSVAIDRKYLTNSFFSHIDIQIFCAVAPPVTSLIIPEMTTSNLYQMTVQKYFEELSAEKSGLRKHFERVDELLMRPIQQACNFSDEMLSIFELASKSQPQDIASIGAYINYIFNKTYTEGLKVELDQMPARIRTDDGRLYEVELPSNFDSDTSRGVITNFEIGKPGVLGTPIYATVQFEGVASGPYLINMRNFRNNNIRLITE